MRSVTICLSLSSSPICRPIVLTYWCATIQRFISYWIIMCWSTGWSRVAEQFHLNIMLTAARWRPWCAVWKEFTMQLQHPLKRLIFSGINNLHCSVMRFSRGTSNTGPQQLPNVQTLRRCGAEWTVYLNRVLRWSILIRQHGSLSSLAIRSTTYGPRQPVLYHRLLLVVMCHESPHSDKPHRKKLLASFAKPPINTVNWTQFRCGWQSSAATSLHRS